MFDTSVELRRYACYLEEIPAPQGLNSVRGPTNVDKWKHIKNSVKKEFLIRQDNARKFTLQVLVDGVNMERIVVDFGSAVATSSVPGNVAQFSARFPSIMCKYLLVLDNRVVIRRFQMGFMALQDFDRCCNSLQQIGFMLKSASILRADEHFQSRTDSILSSQMPAEISSLTPPSSQFHVQNSFSSLTKRPLDQDSPQAPISHESISNYRKDNNQTNGNIQSTAPLDTQTLIGNKVLSRESSSLQEFVKKPTESRVVSTTNHFLNPQYLSKEVGDKASSSPRNKPTREETHIPTKRPNLVASSRENTFKLYKKSLDQCVPINVSKSPHMLGEHIGVVSAQSERVDVPEGAPRSSSHQKIFETKNQSESSGASVVKLPCSQSLIHPLQGLLGKEDLRQPLSPTNGTLEREAIPTRPALTKDLLKERIKDQNFMQWVCQAFRSHFDYLISRT